MKDEMKADCKEIIIRPDMKITGNWTEQQIENIKGVDKAFVKYGITNKFTRIAILSVAAKETRFIPKTETSYNNTPNDRIRQLWWGLFGKMPDHQLTALKSDPVAFFEAVYGNKYGNEKYGDGYKYRGRGYNQITFKGNYKNISNKIGVDIVSKPDLANDADIAALCYIAYLKDRLDTIPASIGVKTWNDFNNLETAIVTVFRANAGWGKDISDKHHQDTLQKCRDYSKCFIY